MSRFIFGIFVGCFWCLIGCDTVSEVRDYAKLYRESLKQVEALRGQVAELQASLADAQARVAEVQTDFNRERLALRRIYEED